MQRTEIRLIILYWPVPRSTTLFIRYGYETDTFFSLGMERKELHLPAGHGSGKLQTALATDVFSCVIIITLSFPLRIFLTL